MTTLARPSRFERPAIQWWPFRPLYIWRLSQYREFTTGRCSPMALVRDTDGSRFAATIKRPPRYPDDTWTVRVVHEDGRLYEITTQHIVAIDCARVQAGYEC